MAKATKPKTAAKKSKLTTAVAEIDADKEAKHAAHMARCALKPSLNAAAVIEPFGEKVFGKLDLMVLASELSESCDALKVNDLSRCESMLFSQAHTLQALFTALARKASFQDGLKQYEAHMRLALKAQSQCRATLETLAAIKNPTAPTFVKQANIAHGPQQVNNGAAALPEHTHGCAPAHGKTENAPNKLLEVTHAQGQHLDTLTPQGAGRAHPSMATVGAVHRP